MTIKYIKTGAKGTAWGPSGIPRTAAGMNSDALDPKVLDTVQTMMTEITNGGETRVLQYCRDLDKWGGPVLLSKDEIAQKCDSVPAQTKADILFAIKQVKAFAEAQLKSISGFEQDIGEGVTAGQKVLPMTTAGCYAPGGRYSHIASAIMSVTTARVAGVKNVILASPPKNATEGIDNAIVYAAHAAGADEILTVGGVQAIAALRFGSSPVSQQTSWLDQAMCLSPLLNAFHMVLCQLTCLQAQQKLLLLQMRLRIPKLWQWTLCLK